MHKRKPIPKPEAKVEALDALERVARAFPQLVDGTDDDINGADFLDCVARAIHGNAKLRKHLKNQLKG